MSARGVLDTSTLILLGRITDVASLPEEPVITAVTLAEFNRLRRAHSVGKTFHAIIRGTKSGFEVANAA